MRSDLSKSLMIRVMRFFTSPQFFIFAFSVILMTAGIYVYNRYFRSDTIVVNSNDKTTPQHPYRKDELALLQITLNEFMELETQKKYEQIYSELGSRRFQEKVPLRVFLKMTNCVEQYLGDLVSYDRNNNGFIRQTKKGRQVDLLQLHVERAETAIEEQVVFEWDGVDVKLGGAYWMTDRQSFHQCIRDVRANKAHLEEAGALEKTTDSSEKKSTQIQPKSLTGSEQPGDSNPEPLGSQPDTLSDDDNAHNPQSSKPVSIEPKSGPMSNLQEEAQKSPNAPPAPNSPAPSTRIEPGGEPNPALADPQ